MIKGQHWEASALAAALKDGDEGKAGKIVVDSVVGDAITVSLPECGGLKVAVAVVRPRIMVSVALAKAAEIPNQADFNKSLLIANPVMPLSAFSLSVIGGEEYYNIYGELSTGSEIEEIEEEILTLGTNAIDSLETIEAWKTGKQAGI